MSDERRLLHPLGSEHLKPHPPAQARWTPEPAAEESHPALEAEAAPERFPVPEMEAAPERLLPNPYAVPAAQDSPEAGEPAPSVHSASEEETDLDSLIAALLSQDDEEEADDLLIQDALLTSQMPEPVCVPLYDDAVPKRKKSRWLWLVFLCLLLLTAGCAWYFGWLPPNWA